MDDEWTLQTTFAGVISQQIGLNLIHRRQGGPTGTTEKTRTNGYSKLKVNWKGYEQR